jgi:hypothetical protein
VTDPTRWRDAPEEAPKGLKDLLDAAAPPTALPSAVRQRGLVRASRLAALPVAATLSWFGLKTAAAAAVTAGLAAVTVVAVQQVTQSQPEAVPAAAPSVITRPETAVIPPPPRLDSPALNPQPDTPSDDPASADLATDATGDPSGPDGADVGASRQPGAVADFSDQASDGLAEETRLLEHARAALATDPARALAITRQHAAGFPAGRLSVERSIIEIQALQRLGRRSEARARGRRMLEQSPRGLYADRVRRILGEDVR